MDDSCRPPASRGRTVPGTGRLEDAVASRQGLPYLVRTAGPATYDCSGFAVEAFRELGLPCPRLTARGLFRLAGPVLDPEPYAGDGGDLDPGDLLLVDGESRLWGTRRVRHVLVALGGGRVAHAESGRGVTVQPLAGYRGREGDTRWAARGFPGLLASGAGVRPDPDYGLGGRGRAACLAALDALGLPAGRERERALAGAVACLRGLDEPDPHGSTPQGLLRTAVRRLEAGSGGDPWVLEQGRNYREHGIPASDANLAAWESLTGA